MLLFNSSLASLSSPHSLMLGVIAFAGARATGECLWNGLILATLNSINDSLLLV